MKVLIADDHWIVRESLKQVLRPLLAEFEVLEAGTFRDVERLLETHTDVELLLIDLVMPGSGGEGDIEHLRQRYPEVPVVVISVYEDRDRVMHAIQLGAIGYIPKSSGPEEIVTALTLVLDGQVAFPRRILEMGSASERPHSKADTNGIDPRVRHPPAGEDVLTKREQEVIDLLGQGQSTARIADGLKVSPHTVRVHLTRIMKKLKVVGRPALMHYAVTYSRSQKNE